MPRLHLRGRATDGRIGHAATAILALCVYGLFALPVLTIRFHICLTARGLLINFTAILERQLQPEGGPVHLKYSP